MPKVTFILVAHVKRQVRRGRVASEPTNHSLAVYQHDGSLKQVYSRGMVMAPHVRYWSLATVDECEIQ